MCSFVFQKQLLFTCGNFFLHVRKASRDSDIRSADVYLSVCHLVLQPFCLQALFGACCVHCIPDYLLSPLACFGWEARLQ